MPYFDIRPKTSRRELYDREEELGKLVRYIGRCSPLILLLGLRRTGKTSLLNASLSETGSPSIVVDCRVFEEKPGIGYGEFLEHFMREASRLASRYGSIAELLRRIEGVEIAGLKIELRRTPMSRALFSTILEKLNSWAEENDTCVVIGLDEAQELVKLRGIRLLPIIAHSYDYLRRISFIITGSQVGLVYRFLRLDDPGSPLYGRVVDEIMLKPFSYEQSVSYLEAGFDEHGMHPPRRVLEKVVERLGGIPGWLTMYGYYAVKAGKYDEGLLDRVVEVASEIVLREYRNFLRTRPPLAAKRYTVILRAVAEGYSEWSRIKRYLEVEEGKKISDSIFSRLLGNLVEAGFLEKADYHYSIPDPVLAYAIRRYRFPSLLL